MTTDDTPVRSLDDETLHAFYSFAVLPQFGIKSSGVQWEPSEVLGSDESAHRFRVDGQSYVLIYEDYDGLGRNADYIRDEVLGLDLPYEFVSPVSETSNPPSYSGFNLPAPFQYVPNITGTFTLIKLLA